MDSKAKLEKHYISLEQKDLLLKFLFKNYKLDLSEYSEASVRRRITKILYDYNLKDTESLCSYLSNRPDGKNEFLEKFTVNVTEMFRDPSFYGYLKSHVFPKLRKLETIKIWSAGCSSGEETISLAIILHEEGLLEKAQIIGSDISLSILNKAKKNSYPLRNAKAYKKAYLQAGGKYDLEQYYVSSGDCFAFESFLLNKIDYQYHNLLDSTYHQDFDLILCRNVLIYFQASLQSKVIDNFQKALISNKFLALGSKESILFYENRDIFQEINGENKIYKKLS